MKRTTSLARRLSLGCIALSSLAALTLASCTQAPVSSALRALESSGDVSFVCLAEPGTDANAQSRPLSDCTSERTGTLTDYAIPHLYALVTQPTRGELAVVDLTSNENAVLDQNPHVPGANFLHIGARPGSIVSSPGGVATFVANTEPNFEGIFAIPSTLIRGNQNDTEPTSLSSWPVCSLPGAPSDMLLLVDPPNDSGEIRSGCDDEYGPPSSTPHPNGNLQLDATSSGHDGVYKLAVTLPSKGGIAIIDAQKLLDQEAGAFEGCPIERWLPLQTVLPPNEPFVPEDDRGGSCAENLEPAAPEVQSNVATPTKLVSTAGTLYASDHSAPVIHRLTVADPCNPVALAPLLPRSTESPKRIVTARELAISPLTLELQRYLYAVDDEDGSIMVFDVSDGSDARTPLTRDITHDPFGAADRIRFQAPVRQLVIVDHQNDQANPDTGSTTPVVCDPDPTSDGPGVVYRTSDEYDSGAGPGTLRGVFAFAVLTSGDVVVIDIEDYDAPCRGPSSQSTAEGCSRDGTDLETTGETSCRVVSPHRPRSATYVVHVEDIATNEPGVTTLPTLFDAEGALLKREETDPLEFPGMRATISADDTEDFKLTVGSEQLTIKGTTGLLDETGSDSSASNTLRFDRIEPRAHLLDQNWTVTYEGRLPGFSGRFAQLTQTAEGFDLRDTSANFCGRGVMSQTALYERAVHEGATTSEASSQSAPRADYVQITSASPVESDAYWTKQNSCTFKACEDAYGDVDTPLTSRDYRIIEANSGSLSIEARNSTPADSPELRCCFPGVVEYAVRTGSQWTVLGSSVGFLNNVSTDDRGVCRPACAGDKEQLHGRVQETIPTGGSVEPITDGSAGAFSNPMFSFAIVSTNSSRDMQFRFTTQNAFRPLTASLLTSNEDLQPQDVMYLPITGELAVTDGSRNGITLLDLNLLQVSRQYN